ncbi:hypothetical protein NAEGRDRAFT_70247 [Naegleria gruberi]|uniref:Glutathione S-transferase n=1 Tax=Naegleria gruberi TaxID=5762 RepID=D2VMS9_NAEGR|nr:uncharacterized protein NAEGRDRAFT_70247 [Naegleria gruberi]EFC41883.1 hypothetical protein NAEGRDRAFT_70247 [Naegleria gruberi]|eukprot:XP_002674627.1 hypothetical protein NAEGRDRAFT_70247 [Naegleria gruberi strain NEG-M]
MAYQLVYFPGPGRADIIKLIAEHCAIPYEFKSISFEDGSWTSTQPNTRYGQLPSLKVDEDFTLYQTIPIARFLAKQANFHPTDERNQAILEECVSAIDELTNHVIRIVYFTSEDKKEEERVKFQNGWLKLIMKGLNSHLIKNNGNLVPGGLSWADLYLYDLLSYLDLYRFEVVVDDSKLETLKANVLKSERVKAYLESPRNLKKH